MEENVKTKVMAKTSKKKVNPTFEALVKLRGAMHTNDPKFAWSR